MALSFANNASTTLAADIAHSDTTLTVATGDGALFPDPATDGPFRITVVSSVSGVLEIMECTARSGDTLTVVRGKEGTPSYGFLAGDTVENRVTAETLGVFAQTVSPTTPGFIATLDSTGNISGELDPSSIAPTYTTVSDMKAASISAGVLVRTKGYYAAGDGGQATYLIKTAADYGATPDGYGDHTLANGNVAVLQISNSPNIKQFGAKSDGISDDLAPFTSAEAAGKSPVLVTANTRMSSAPAARNIVYELLNGATVTIDTGQWYPKEYRQIGDWGTFSRKTNFSSADPSPTITGSEYVIIDEAPNYRSELINYWGAQYSDVNDNTKGRTAVDSIYAKVTHYGEGDAYLIRTNGGVRRHSRYSSITSPRGHNNLGMFNGQVNALSPQVTLYGLGDVVLHDNGYDNVALRGMNFYLYANGADTLGYDCDRFGIRVASSGTNDCDVAYVSSGNWRIDFDATKSTATSGTSIALSSDKRISFDCSGATTASGYGATVFSNYHIYKPAATAALRLEGNGGLLDIKDTLVTYTPGVAGNSAMRVTAGSTQYAEMRQLGSVSYFIAGDTGTSNTILSLRTASAGTERDVLILSSNGNVNLNVSGAVYQVGGVDVLGARKTGWAAATGTATRTTFNTATVTTAQLAERVKALIDDLTAHGLIGV